MQQARLGAGGPCVALVLALWATRAAGAGFDTPILYTARHQAMGGTAIGYVDDASAGFHNPAGISAIHRFNVLADVSLLVGKVQATPERGVTSHESETTLAPFFLLAGGARVSEWLTLGLGLFPVASGGAEYKYQLAGNPFVDSTSIVFAELTPFASAELPRMRALPGRLSIGVGYRMSALFFSREKGNPEDPRILNLHMTGTNFSGVRLGLQYRPSSAFSVGFVFRNKIRVVTRADDVTVYTQTARDAELDFVLPAKLGAGMAFDIADLRLASDVEYAFQDQNQTSALTGQLGTTRASVPNVFAWQNGMTLRFGAEYRLGQGDLRYPVRVGYAFDSTVTNPQYPSAFGTPPAPTHTFSGGGGVRSGALQVNLAITRRFGSTSIAPETLGEGCAFCSYAGDYSIGMTGIYVDSSFDF
jgi:long-subunit fatty acid transport protein